MPNENDEIPEVVPGEGENGSEPVKTPPEGMPSALPPKEKTVPYERFKDVNDKYQELLKSKGTPEDVEEWEAPSDPIEIVKLSKETKDLSEEEMELAMRLAGTKNLEGIRKAIKDPWFQTAIQAQREKVARENKIPSPSSPTTPFSQDAKKVVQEGNVAEMAAKEAAELEAKEGRGGGI